MIMVLDPRQLPPVPDKTYGDDGKFCFESELWHASIIHTVGIHISRHVKFQLMLYFLSFLM